MSLDRRYQKRYVFLRINELYAENFYFINEFFSLYLTQTYSIWHSIAFLTPFEIDSSPSKNDLYDEYVNFYN